MFRRSVRMNRNTLLCRMDVHVINYVIGYFFAMNLAICIFVCCSFKASDIQSLLTAILEDNYVCSQISF